jgi:hypothetical protein
LKIWKKEVFRTITAEFLFFLILKHLGKRVTSVTNYAAMASREGRPLHRFFHRRVTASEAKLSRPSDISSHCPTI